MTRTELSDGLVEITKVNELWKAKRLAIDLLACMAAEDPEAEPDAVDREQS